MTTVAIIGTAVSVAIMIGIAIGLSKMSKKLTPPAPQIAADPERKKLPVPESAESDDHEQSEDEELVDG